jgi:hypothetical protein
MPQAPKIRRRRLALIALVVTALVGCGEGYRLDPACLNVTGITDESKEQLLASVSRACY